MNPTDTIRRFLQPQPTNLPVAVTDHEPPAPTDPDRPTRTAGSRGRRRVVLVVALVVALGVSFLLGRSSAPDVTATTPVNVPITVHVPAAVTSPQEADRIEAENTARAFVNAWLTRGTPELRLRAMQPLSTGTIAQRLANDRTDFLPRGYPAAAPYLVLGDEDAAELAMRLTDGYSVNVRLTKQTGTWLVYGMDH